MAWTNSDYGYIYHLAGNCHTPEEAHRVLTESISTRKMAIREYEHALKRRKIDEAKLQKQLDNSTDELDKEGLLLDIEKLNIHNVVEQIDYEYALHEVEFITTALNVLEPHCNWFSGAISQKEGYQLVQQEERRLILLERANLGLLSCGTIDSETLREVKTHPEMKRLEADFMAMLEDKKNDKLRLMHNKPMLLLVGSSGSSGGNSSNSEALPPVLEEEEKEPSVNSEAIPASTVDNSEKC
jgi:hypothetical protein